MRIKNKKLAAVGVLFTCLLVAVLVCQLLYVSNVNWIIGKNSAQIQEKYGKFDHGKNIGGSSGEIWTICFL